MFHFHLFSAHYTALQTKTLLQSIQSPWKDRRFLFTNGKPCIALPRFSKWDREQRSGDVELPLAKRQKKEAMPDMSTAKHEHFAVKPTVEFAKMAIDIKEVLLKNNIRADLLIERLCAVTSHQLPIFNEDMFEEVNSIDKLWDTLSKFWKIFDYDLLILVVDLAECAEAHKILDNFQKKCNLFALHDCALEYYDPLQNIKYKTKIEPRLLKIKVDVKEEKCTVDYVMKLKEHLCKVLDLQKYDLYLKRIHYGCIELTYYVLTSDSMWGGTKAKLVEVPQLSHDADFYGQSHDFEEKKVYALAMKKGKAKPSSIRILIAGTENAGKTCLVGSLLGEEFKPNEATKGVDVGVCKIFSTNWSRLKINQAREKLQKNFCSELKAIADRMIEGEDVDEDEALAFDKSPENSEGLVPTAAVTPADDETQLGSSLSLSLLVNEEEIPILNYDDLSQVHQSSPDCENDISAVIWDVSGQTVYHGLLSPFLTEDNVAIIVFDASQDLSKPPQPRSPPLRSDKCTINPKMTGCEIICYWFNSFYSHCHKNAIKKALSRNLPTIFLVATKIDLIGDSNAISQKKEEIIDLLANAFEGKCFAGLLAGNCGSDGIMEALKRYCFFVSNVDRDRAVFTELKTALVEASQHHLDQPHPVAYIKIECQLLDINKGSITTSEFIEISRKCGFPVNPGTTKFYGALKYFHHKGVALHFLSIKSLQNLIVLSPQWLVKLLAYVIVAHPFKKFGSPLDKQYTCLTELGILHKEFFDYMVKCFNEWQTSNCQGVTIDSKQAMDFVDKFNFVAEIDSNVVFLNEMKRYQNLRKSKDKLYIVPSMLPEEIPETSGDALFQKVIRDIALDDSEDKDVRVLYFNFPDGFVPIAVFSQVLATCIKRNGNRSEDVIWLGRYHCKLVLGEDQFYYVILHKSKTSICLVFSPDESGTVGVNGVKERLKLFEEFHENLLSSLKAVAKSLENPIPCIPCPWCDCLHLNLDLIRGKSKRLLRCSTRKISPDYYSDFRETIDEEDSSPHESPPRKKVKLSSESAASSSGDVQKCTDEEDSSPHESPPRKKVKMSSESVISSSGDVQNMSSSEKKEGCPTLSEWLSCLKDVTKWKTFAAYLLPSDSVVAETDVIDKNCRGDVNECKRELYSTYTQLGERTWTKVVEALEKSSHINIAKEIKTKFHL